MVKTESETGEKRQKYVPYWCFGETVFRGVLLFWLWGPVLSE